MARTISAIVYTSILVSSYVEVPIWILSGDSQPRIDLAQIISLHLMLELHRIADERAIRALRDVAAEPVILAIDADRAAIVAVLIVALFLVFVRVKRLDS